MKHTHGHIHPCVHLAHHDGVTCVGGRGRVETAEQRRGEAAGVREGFTACLRYMLFLNHSDHSLGGILNCFNIRQ